MFQSLHTCTISHVLYWSPSTLTCRIYFVFRFRPSGICSLLLLFPKTHVQDWSRVLNEGRNSCHGSYSSSRSEHVEDLRTRDTPEEAILWKTYLFPPVNYLALIAPFLDRFFLCIPFVLWFVEFFVCPFCQFLAFFLTLQKPPCDFVWPSFWPLLVF